MGLTDKAITEFMEELASKAPAPGGGGASALAGALGAALGTMVGNLTVGKAKYAAVEPEVRALMERSERIRARLTELIDEDAKAFAPLAAAYAIPRDAPGRDETMEACLKAAAAVPMEILELSREAVGLMDGYAGTGSVLAVSDAATGAALLRGALCGAAANVRVNTRLMKDREAAERLNKRVYALLSEGCRLADAVFADVYDRLRCEGAKNEMWVRRKSESVCGAPLLRAACGRLLFGHGDTILCVAFPHSR